MIPDPPTASFAWDMLKTIGGFLGALALAAFGMTHRRIDRMETHVETLRVERDNRDTKREGDLKTELAARDLASQKFRDQLMETVATKDDLQVVRSDIREIRGLLESRADRIRAGAD